jgi:glycosyltransferase involved in cell wall biosynthesis
MRITYIHQYFSTLDSAGGTRSFILSKYLVYKGHEVTVITSNSYLPEKLKDIKEFELSGIKVLNIKTNYTFNLNFSQRLLAFIKFMIFSSYLALKTSPDLIFATSTPLTVAFPGLFVKLIKGIPFVFEVRDLWPDVPIELGIIKNKFLIFLLKLFEKIIYRFANKIVCISEGIRERISVPNWKKVYIPIGCDLGLFTCVKNTRWKEEVGISGRSLFVFTGAIGVANCPEYLMEAAKILKRKKGHDISIVIVGKGSAKEKILKIKNKYCLNNVTILDAVPKKKLPDILASADGGIILHGISSTYRFTASPNKFYDYIAAGLPIIFNFEGPLKDLILNKNAGYYVDYQFPYQLSEVLLHILQNKSEASEFGKNARRLAEGKFDQKKIVIQFENVLVDCYKKHVDLKK